GDLVHVDFVRVSTDVAIAAEVALHLEGEAVGVRDGGLLEQIVFTGSIEAKPQGIPGEIVIDISEPALGDQLGRPDVQRPPGVVTTLDPETLVVHVSAPRVGAIEGEEGVEGEEGAEGEAPAAEAASGESAEGGEE